MGIDLANESKPTKVTLSNTSKNQDWTWNSSDPETWEDQDGTWESQRVTLSKESKSKLYLSNESK